MAETLIPDTRPAAPEITDSPLAALQGQLDALGVRRQQLLAQRATLDARATRRADDAKDLRAQLRAMNSEERPDEATMRQLRDALADCERDGAESARAVADLATALQAHDAMADRLTADLAVARFHAACERRDALDAALGDVLLELDGALGAAAERWTAAHAEVRAMFIEADHQLRQQQRPRLSIADEEARDRMAAPFVARLVRSPIASYRRFRDTGERMDFGVPTATEGFGGDGAEMARIVTQRLAQQRSA